MRWFQKPKYVVRHDSTRYVWTQEKAHDLKRFLETETGKALLMALDDRIYELYLNRKPMDFVEGMLYAMSCIRSMLPKEQREEYQEEDLTTFNMNT